MAQSLTLEDVQPKLRMVTPKPPGERAISVTAYQSTRVTALENGINLNRRDGGLIQYPDISLLFAFQLDVDPDTWYIDLFVYGQPSAFRLSQKAINYRQFLPEVSQRSKDNFYAFLLYLIDQTDSVHVDDHTLDFLKTKKMTSFPDFKLVEDYTGQLWFQIVSWMKFQCEQCGEVYWVDDTKVTKQKAKTKCVKCQNVITVRKREKPVPLKPKEKQKKISCPHCQYENPAGSQFCVMCQNPLTTIKPPKAPTEPAQAQEPALSKKEPEPSKQESAPPKQEALDLSNLPLQARGQRKPYRSFREIAMSLQDDINTLENKFAWFAQFSWIMQLLGFIFFVGGILIGIYIRFVMKVPIYPPELTMTLAQRWTYAGISVGVGVLLSLASIITSNIIALTLEIERNTKISSILLQKLVEREEEE